MISNNSEFLQISFLCLQCNFDKTIRMLHYNKIRQIAANLYVVYFLVGMSFSEEASSQQTLNLDYFINVARSNNPILNDYNNQAFILKIDSLKLKSDYGFKLDGVVDATYSPVVNKWGYDITLSNAQSVTGIVKLSKEIIGKGNINSRKENYGLGIQQLVNESQITVQSLNRAITEQYINTYASQQQYQVISEVVHLLEQEDDVLSKLTQKATFKQTDYLSFKVTLQQNILTLKQCYAEWKNEYALLNYLSGIVNPDIQNIDPPTLNEDRFVPFEESIYAQKSNIDSLKLTNEAKIINYNYKPRLSAYADAGYSSTFAIAPYKNLGWSAGVSLSIPIYDGNKKKMQLRQNKLSQDTRARYSEFTRKQYEQQILQLQDQIMQYNQIIQVSNEQMVYAKTLIEANLKQLPTGDVKVVDFIFSINSYLNLKSGLIKYETNLYTLRNYLHNLIIQ